MKIKEQAKENFIKYLAAYFDQNFDDFTIKRLNRMLDEFDEAIPKLFTGDLETYKKGYKEGYDDAKRYYTKKITDDNNISSVLL
jgi:hypothetical protein